MTNASPDTDSPSEIAPTREVHVGEEPLATTILPTDLSGSHSVYKDRTGLEDSINFEMPQVGQSFLGFDLLAELGRGTSGRVFLCKQSAMADRHVVLKVTKAEAPEVQTLARLKHTNIVPIYSAYSGPGYSAICMPYYGGFSFAAVLSRLREQGTPHETGECFVNLLSERPGEQTGFLLAAKTLSKMTYEDAVLWFGARLAEGLAHAHDRGLVHCDIKPANILLADDGQPMLLDFDVALDLRTAGNKLSMIGGTLQYMSTEQLELLLEKRKLIDRRSDLYSLGLVLYELLTGQLPYEPPEDAGRQEVERALQVRNTPPVMPNVSSTVEAIVRKCLMANPMERYPSAGAFVDDVQRHLTHQPLKYAKVRSVRERAWKWMKRNPRLTSPTMFVAMATVVVLSLGLFFLTKQQRALSLEAEQQREHALAAYRDLLPKLRHAQIDMLNAFDRPKLLLQANNRAEQLLAKHHIGDNDPWRETPTVALLPGRYRELLEAEIGTLYFLLACAQKPLKKDDGTPLTRAEAYLGNRAEAALAHLAQARGAEKRKAHMGLDRLLLAIYHYVAKQPVEALAAAKEYTQEFPDALMGWLMAGHCHAELRQDSAAIACYSACIALRSDVPEVYVRRGWSLFQQRDFPAALADLDMVVRWLPNHQEARIYRSQTHQQMGNPALGVSDLDVVLRQPDAPVKVYFMRARLYQMLGDEKNALADETAGMKHIPTDEASWVERGVLRLRTNPEGALDDFRKAEQLNPRSFPALHNQAYVLTEHLKKPQEAIQALNRVLTFYPDYAPSLADRAILLARSGDHAGATRDAQRAGEKDRRPNMQYQVAAVYALLSQREKQHQKTALRYLANALRGGYGLDKIHEDHDFDPLRETTSFHELLNAAKTLALTSQ